MDCTNVQMKEHNKYTSKFNFPESTKDFIKTNFQIRECYKFKEKTKDICLCNRERINHTESSKPDEDWSYDNNTTLKPCNTFGYINFQGYGYNPCRHFPKFIRFNCVENEDQACERIYNLLTEHEPWKIPTPKLIISINGGLKRMKAISHQQKKNFKQGLIEVIKKDQTWVLGSGFNVGIHKLLSETINEFRLQQDDMKDQVSLIGISTWGTVYNNSYLTMPPGNSTTHSSRHQLFKYENTSFTEKGKVNLDALYDNLLFCDDGTEKQYDKDIEFRLKFENLVRKKTDGFVVQILFEGGRRAIRNVYFSLQDKVPLVVIKGSGRGANIISEIMELPIKNCKEAIKYIVNDNKDILDIPKGKEGDDEIEEYIEYLYAIYTTYKKQVVVYDMTDTVVRFDKKILEAMIIGADKSLEKTLKLCIRFNCPTIAERFVFCDPKYGNMDPIHIETMFMGVLKDNKAEFVNLFMENNFDIEKFITEERLKELYKVSFEPEKCQCAELLFDLLGYTNNYFRCVKKYRDCEPDILCKVDLIIQKLSGNLLNNRYKDFLSNKINVQFSDVPLSYEDEDLDSEEDYTMMTLTSQDLFLWSLVSGRTSLSKILWKTGKDHIGSALIASNMLARMASLVLVRGDNNLGRKLTDASTDYQNIAISIISESFNASKSKTYTLIVREQTRWDNLTCLEIAINGHMLDFLNHSACRSFTTKVWMGDLSPFLPTWKIIMTIPLSLIMMKLVIMPSFPPKKCPKEDSSKVKFQNKLLIPEKEKSPDPYDLKKNSKRNISFVKAMSVFYRSPIVKFYIHLFSYIAFLIIFSYLNLIELKPIEDVKFVSEVFAEIYVYVYILTFIIEEIRQVVDQEIWGFKYKVAVYFSGTWNKFDAFIILLFTISIITRFTIPQHHFMLCRCLFSVTLSMFFLRTMQFYFVNKSIGPKVIMIGNMLRDILFFLNIFVIFLMAYGTLAQSLQAPNSKFGLDLFKDVVHNPYFQTYGELMLDSFQSYTPNNRTDYIVKSAVVMGSFAIFLLLTNILLINLLIAMFGYTFNQIQDDSEKLWSFIRIQLVQEFYEKPIFPPPFNIIYYGFRIISWPCKSVCPKIIFGEEDNLLSQPLTHAKNFQISVFEQLCMETAMIEYNEQKSPKNDKTNPEMINMADLVDKLNVKSELVVPNNPVETVLSFQARFDKRLDNIERQMGYSK